MRQNLRASRIMEPMTELQVSELFYSLQGESTRAGLPCFFIRLAGCNLRCNYCDASYTYEEAAHMMTLEEILAAVAQHPDVMVEITGGEPLLQKGCFPLIDSLLAQGHQVLIESNGSIVIDQVPPAAVVILDIKCPGSGSADSFAEQNLEVIRKRLLEQPHSVEIKFVLSDSNDYIWARNFVRRHLADCAAAILFSPVIDRLPPRELARLIMDDHLPVRLQLQLHTQIWPDASRGV